MNKTDLINGKKRITSIPARGRIMGVCATLNRKYICCNVHVLKDVQNCPFECSYCFLQDYLTDGATKIMTDVESIMREIREKTGAQPGRLFRIGTWELGDSLALERRTGHAARLIREFAGYDNALLELKTKSDNVEPILSLDHGGRTVVSWSVNTDHIITTEEQGTAPLYKRLNAIHRAARTGYLIGIHFDPMILYEGWEEDYEILVKRVFDAVQKDRVAWISIGSLRFNPEMKKKIECNYPGSRLTCAEMVCGDDFKVRYVKPVRIDMYRRLYMKLREYSFSSEADLVYLCMERWDVWDRVFGWHPDSIEHLDYLFAQSLYKRFGIGKQAPERDMYETAAGDADLYS